MLKVHLGCGKRDFGPDWFHVDGAHFPHVKHHDILQLPFARESVDLIYASHVLEYFDRFEVRGVLAKWHEFLRPGATLRVAVPDFEVLARLYVSGAIRLQQVLGPLYGRMPMNDVTIYHRTAYDFASLSAVLEEAGYSHVRRYDWRQTEHAQFDDHSQAYIPHMDKEHGTLISLNVECTR
jgi:predicted SAM-dependent methyltransferase